MSAPARSFRVLSVLTLAVGLSLGMASQTWSAAPSSQAGNASATQPARELTLGLGNKVTMKLVWIPAGKFMMGSSKDEQEAANRNPKAQGSADYDFTQEGPQHEVTISKAFYLGVYDVTQEQYEQVMGKNPSHFRGAQNPVEMVSWADAVELCQKVSAKTGKTVRLPTEAEWEYACRAGTNTPFHTGETISTDQANYDGNYVYGTGVKGEYRQTTTPGATFKPNALGLYDMHGNVWEWCADWSDATYYANSPTADPTGPADGKLRVLRGGSWYNSPRFCRSAIRGRIGPGTRHGSIGFRVVVVAAGLD